jgi:hypothetical protein
MKLNRFAKCGGALVLVLPFAACAQYTIDWHTFGGGGGTSTGGVYSVSGSIGQLDAGPVMNGGNFSLVGGFWSLTAVQVPGAPLLSVFLTATNTAIIAWPAPSAGFVLQQKAEIDATAWAMPSEGVIDNGTNRFIIVKPPTGNRYYRLFKP